jgi:RecB family exonuclease
VTPHIDELMVHLDRVWDEVSYDAVWQADVERGKARDALINFLSWQAANERRLIGAEEEFEMDVTIAGRNVHLSGKIDRLELTAEGKVVVIDLKTMKSAPSKDSTQENPQLGLYQLAVREGALNDAIAQFRELPAPDEEITGGAELVLLRLTSYGKTTVREQSALAPDEPGTDTWMDELLEDGVAQIASGAFPPVVTEACTFCDFKTACPAQDHGQGVIA